MSRVLVVLTACALVWGVSNMTPAHTEEKTIVDEWKSVEVPPAPKLEAVTVDPQSSGYCEDRYFDGTRCRIRRG